MKIGLSILIILLWVFNYDICEYFYANDIDSWWKLKINIYGICIALCFGLLNMYVTKKKERFIINIGAGLAISNVVDRFFYDVNTFTKSDTIMIILTVIFAIYDYYGNK